MIINPADVTVDDFNTAAYKLAISHPDRVNPVVNGSCVYTKQEDDGTVSHCIVGQILAGWGFDLAQFDSEGAYNVLAVLGFTTDVADRASAVQQLADQAGRPVPWGTLIEQGVVTP